MKRRPQHAILNDGDRVLVIGGGPAGSFFAIHLLRESRRAGRRLDVTIIEKKRPLESEGEPWLCKGCNFCAGAISPRLNRILEQNKIYVPEGLVCEEFHCLWLQGLWKNFPLKVPEDTRLYSVFRGSLPPTMEDKTGGLDGFLMKEAAREGARIVRGEALEIEESPSGLPRLILRTSPEETEALQAHFIALSTGVNIDFNRNYGEIEIFRSLRRMNPGFVPAKTRKALIFELEVGREYLNRYMRKELYFVEFGSRELLLEHIALIPKGDYLTAVLIGKSVDDASLPRDTRRIVAKFLSLPHIRRILPHINLQNTSVVCSCAPWLTVGTARQPHAERLSLVGDTVGSRLYKDGLFSAYISSRDLARTILNLGVDRRSLARGYGKTLRWLRRDTRYGRLVLWLSGLAFSNRTLSRILYQAFATELKIREKSKRPFSDVLWKIASGDSDYRDIFRGMLDLRVIWSLLMGGLIITVRNIATEIFFGLKWGEFGRYPTVVLKEKRDQIKKEMASSLGTALDSEPDFECMYTIKIRAPSEEIFGELGTFGERGRKFLKIRFVDIRRISGGSNEIGSVLRYRLRGLGLFLDMRLARSKLNRTLLYEVSEKYADRGKLAFEITPKNDGNYRLAIYAAFDFKRGRGILSGLFWRLFRMVFPAYLHDVVWNHALCCIKEEAEQRSQGILSKL